VIIEPGVSILTTSFSSHIRVQSEGSYDNTYRKMLRELNEMRVFHKL
jgi:hypothetical protein